MLNHKLRKSLLWTLIICMLSMFAFSVAAFADENTTESTATNESGTQYAKTIDDKNNVIIENTIIKLHKLEESVQITETDKFKEMVNTIPKLALGSDDPDVQVIYDEMGNVLTTNTTIPEVTIEYGYRKIDQLLYNYSSAQRKRIASYWKPVFYSKAASYGIPVNENVEDLIEDNTKTIGMLKWGGKDLASTSKGTIFGIIQKIYSIQGSQNQNLGDFINCVKGIGMALCVAFSIMTMTSMATERNMTSEALTKEFGKLLFGIWLISNFQWIAASLLRLGALILESITMISDVQPDIKIQMKRALVESLWEVAQNTDLGGLMAETASGGTAVVSYGSNPFTKLIGDMVGGGLTNFIASMSVYAVAIEMGIRYAFTPLAIADMFSEKFRSTGVRYLKELLACSLTGAIMYFIVYVTYALKVTIMPTIIANAAIELTMVGMMARARNIASSIVGS